MPMAVPPPPPVAQGDTIVYRFRWRHTRPHRREAFLFLALDDLHSVGFQYYDPTGRLCWSGFHGEHDGALFLPSHLYVCFRYLGRDAEFLVRVEMYPMDRQLEAYSCTNGWPVAMALLDILHLDVRRDSPRPLHLDEGANVATTLAAQYLFDVQFPSVVRNP